MIRKILGFISAAAVLIVSILILGSIVEQIFGYNDFLRLPVMFISFIAASITYSLIRGEEEEPEIDEDDSESRYDEKGRKFRKFN